MLQDQVDDQLQAQFSFIQSQAHFQTQSQEPFILEPAHAQLHAQSQALESLIQAQAQAQAHLALIAQLSKKVESLQVSANLNRISDHVLRVGVASRSPHPDAQEEMVSGFDNVAKIATSVGSSSRTNPDVAQHLGRIASLAQQMSTKAQSIKAVKGTPINADDEIQLAEIQQLINQVESIHCQSITEEALSVRHLDEAAGHSNEIALLEESINNLEELLEKRDEELQASSSRITFLLGDFSQNQFTSDPPTARFGSFKKAEHKILDLGQGNDGLAQENNQLRSQLTHLHEKIRDMQSDRELQRQQTEVSSKYHGQTIESQGMELGISQISDLSGMPQCIRPSETSEEVERLLDQVAELTDAIAIHERDLQAENDRNSHLQAEIQKMALAIEQLRSETERKDKEIMESKESSSRGIKELKHTVSSHEMDLSTKNEELKLTQKQIDEMNNRLSKAIEELNRARTEKAEIESFASSQISVLKSEVDQLRMELTRSKSLEDNSSHLKSQIDYLSSQLNQSGDIAERERKLAQEIGRLQIERESIEKEKKEIVNLQNQVLDRNESRLRKFSEQGDVDHELQGRVDKLEKDLKDAKEERSRFINKLKEAENAKKIVDIELLETRKQREKIERTWKEKIERLERRCTEFDKDIKTKDSTIDKLDIENGKLHQQLKELKDDLKSSRSELFKLSQSVAPSESPNVNPSQRQSNTSGVVEITGEITNSRIEDSAQQGKEIKKSKQTRRESEGINEESPSKSSQVKIQDEPSTGKKTQSKKDADRKVSNNDAGSWMESEDSEDPSKLFQSYVPPASLIKPVHDVADMRDSKVSDKISSKIENKSEVIKAARDENSRKTDQKSEANKTSRDENASKTDKWSDANRTSRDEYSSKANKKSDTDRTARDEYSVKTQKGEKSSSNVNEVRSPSQTVGDSQVIKKSKTSDSRGQKSKRSGRVRAYEDEYEDVYYIKKIDTIRDVASEYIEKLKQSTKTEERGSKTKREETGEDTDRQEQPNSTPNRFQKEEKKSKKKTTFEPTYVDSEFVAKKKENLIQNVSMEQEEARLHFSVVESQNKNVKDEIKAMSKSQQNPYTSPLLRAEDFEGYDQGDCLIKVSEYAMNNFEVENPERDHVIEEEDEEENEDAAKTERKSTTVGKSSNQPNASGEGKKKKKKKAKSTASGNEPLSQAREWLSLMGMKLT